MADREKVINDLDEISLYFYGCYRNAGGGTRACEKFHDWMCAVDEAKEALSRLKAQEARVMTLEEIEDALDNVVWLDIPGAENLADGFSLIMAYSRKNGFVLLDSPFGDNPSQDRFEYTDYNKTWRCWTARPTDEQREAVKWDEPPKEG